MPEGVKTVLQWAIGIAALALVFVVVLILFGNLSGNLGFSDQTVTRTNEAGYSINGTTYTLTNGASTPNFVSLTVTQVLNASDGVIIASGNYTIDGTLGTIVGTAGRTSNYTSVNITYIVSYNGNSEVNTENVISNYSQSAVNTSSQFPVVGTILGVAILLIVLILILAFAIKKMMGLTDNSRSNTNNISFR